MLERRYTSCCVVDGEEKPASNAHTVSIHQPNTQQSSYGGIYCRPSFHQYVSAAKFILTHTGKKGLVFIFKILNPVWAKPVKKIH